MCEEIEVSYEQPTDAQEEVRQDRGIDELLSLGTYQGMTDSEIEKVIAWNMNVAYNNGLNSAEAAQLSEAQRQLIEKSNATCDAIVSMVESVRNREVPMGVIGLES